MKKNLFELSSDEKNRILEMHENATKKQYLTEQDKTTYTVQRGDNLTKIASKYKTTVAQLAKDNNIKNVNLIRVGQVLTVPNVNKPISTGGQTAVTTGVQQQVSTSGQTADTQSNTTQSTTGVQQQSVPEIKTPQEAEAAVQQARQQAASIKQTQKTTKEMCQVVSRAINPGFLSFRKPTVSKELCEALYKCLEDKVITVDATKYQACNAYPPAPSAQNNSTQQTNTQTQQTVNLPNDIKYWNDTYKSDNEYYRAIGMAVSQDSGFAKTKAQTNAKAQISQQAGGNKTVGDFSVRAEKLYRNNDGTFTAYAAAEVNKANVR